MEIVSDYPGQALQELQPLVRELPADLETPVSVYLKLSGQGPSFLLESVSGGEQLARYSFIGVNPSKAYVLRGQDLETTSFQAGSISTTTRCLGAGENPLDALRQVLAPHQHVPVHGLPRFSGGLVGYFGYEVARFFESSLPLSPHPDLPDAIFLLADVVVAFDHAFGRMLLIANPGPDGLTPNDARDRLDDIERRLALPVDTPVTREHDHNGHAHANMTQAEYELAVLRAKEHIAAGDIFQVVLSQRLSRQTHASPFDIYRALRRLNPSPYLFYFDFDRLAGGSDDFCLIGASPEMHVRLEAGVASVRPIAGTRKRGNTPEDEIILEQELLADPKECAEHVMLVDLGRNDLGRLCEYGSVHVSEQMSIERYSHVIHLVSHVEGKLRPEYDAFDLLQATFPAGTVSGAPKIRAMQIIHDLETTARGPYAGAVGYFSYDGSMDTCIAIRTMVVSGQKIFLQAGAGIVADSIPQNEYQETLNKLRALSLAVDLAENNLTNGNTKPS
jgi:anthranilate synthase component 1